ncbi:unnamed protein product [Lactuca saligna]|uniref:Uncharacterized protein n=1 Tax=Lactuca saligna TaxID=75948 RepID=A0AA36EI52_LACSI|nr:unnamed protein product [Lactuca saligna]
MASYLSFLALFFFVTIMCNVYGRPNPEELLENSHVGGGSLASLDPTKRSHCNQRKSSNEEFEPRPNVSVYDNSAGLKGKKMFDEEFENNGSLMMIRTSHETSGVKPTSFGIKINVLKPGFLVDPCSRRCRREALQRSAFTHQKSASESCVLLQRTDSVSAHRIYSELTKSTWSIALLSRQRSSDRVATKDATEELLPSSIGEHSTPSFQFQSRKEMLAMNYCKKKVTKQRLFLMCYVKA